MVDYVERFHIPGISDTGIEDYDQPGDHFMPQQPHKRFKVWSGGSGGWERDTIDEARKMLHDYVCEKLDRRIDQLQQELEEVQLSRNALGDDVFNLGQFLVKKE